MHYSIDGKLYSVAIASRPIVLDGALCRAKIDHRNRRVLICGLIARHDRRRELFHELTHAWRGAHGMPAGEEQDATQTSALMDVVIEQYLVQGGDAVLEAMNPPAEAPDNPNPSGALFRVYTDCGYCAAPVAIGSIGNESPEWCADVSSWTMARGLLCTVCDRVTLWREHCTAEGMPTGRLLPHPPPRVVSGEEAAAWIAEHARVCGAVVRC